MTDYTKYRSTTLELLNGNARLEQDAWNFWSNTKNPELSDSVKNYKSVMTTIVEAVNNNTFDVNGSFPTSIFDFNKKRWENYSDARPSQAVKVEQTTTDMFQCGRCKERRCTYYTAQIRSGDEAATIFIQCQNCGLNFRM